jgi:CDP-diacylglycerol--glycerol-3-phosphate 3-phosphatidyltransferase
VFGFLGLLLGLGVRLEPVIPYLLGVMALLLMLTIWNRARQALGEVQAESSAK